MFQTCYLAISGLNRQKSRAEELETLNEAFDQNRKINLLKLTESQMLLNNINIKGQSILSQNYGLVFNHYLPDTIKNIKS
jgi:hypothetical protein